MWTKDDLPPPKHFAVVAGIAACIGLLTLPFDGEKIMVAVLRFTGFTLAIVSGGLAAMVEWKPDWAVVVITLLAEKPKDESKPETQYRAQPAPAPETGLSDWSHFEFVIFAIISGVFCFASVVMDLHWGFRLLMFFVSLVPVIFGWQASDCKAKGNTNGAVHCLTYAGFAAVMVFALFVIVIVGQRGLNMLTNVFDQLFGMK